MEKIYVEIEKIEHEPKPKRESVHQTRRKRESEQILNMIKEHRKFKEQEQVQFEDLDRNITNNLLELNKMRHETE